MKWQIVRTLLLGMAFMALPAIKGQAQIVTDPTLNAAVMNETSVIGDKLDETNSNQRRVVAQNTLMMATLDSIRGYQKTVLRSLQKVHGVFDNIFTAVDCVDRVGKIITELNQLRIVATNHPEGAVVSAIVSERYSKIIREVGGLIDNINDIVKKGGDDILLNSAERFEILNNTNTRLRTIYSNVRALRYQIMCYEWADIARKLSPDLYYSMYDVDAAYKRCKRDIDKLQRIF